MPAWMAPGALAGSQCCSSRQTATLAPDVEEAARAALLGEQDAAMRAALAPQQHSGHKRDVRRPRRARGADSGGPRLT